MAGSIAAERIRTLPPARERGLSVSGALAVFEYCARVYRRNWRGTMFMTFFSPILFLAAMGLGLGSFVNNSAGAAAGTAASTAPGAAGALAGASYLAFLAPGLLAAVCMQTAGFEASYPIMGRLVWDKVYFAMMATPISVSDIVAGQLGWIAVRLALVATAFFAVMTLFGVPSGPQAVLAIPVGVLTGMSFAGPITAFSGTQRNDSGFNVIFRFVITPLFLFSGTFFPVERLPQLLQPVAWLTPTYHGVALARDVSLGIAQLGPSLLHLAVLSGYVVAGIVATSISFRRALIK